MTCNQTLRWLETHGKRPLREYPDELRAHVGTCVACRRQVEDLQIQYSLSQLPVLAPTAGYADRALHEAWLASTQRRANKTFKLSLALAASVMVVAVGVKLAMLQSPAVSTPSTSTSSTAQTTPATLHQLDLLLQSPQTYANSHIRIEFSETVKLVGYNDVHELHWQTDIKKGNNQLSLPLELSGVADGTVTLHVEAMGRTKQMRFVVGAGSGARVAGLVALPIQIPNEV